MSTISYNFYEQFKEKAHIFFIHTPKMSIIQQFPIKDPFFHRNSIEHGPANASVCSYIHCMNITHTYIHIHDCDTSYKFIPFSL